jgi:hypothetical protein
MLAATSGSVHVEDVDALERAKSGRDIVGASDANIRDLEAELAGRRLDLAHLQHSA